MKKLYIFLVVLVVAVAAGYFFWYAKLENTDSNNNPGEKSASVIVSDKVVSPINSYDNTGLWFGLDNGQMMKYDLNSGQLTEYPLPLVEGETFNKIYWPLSGNDFISSGLVQNRISYNYFSFVEKKYYRFPNNVQALDWLYDSKRVVLVWKAGDGKVQLVISNPDTTGYRIVTQLPWDDLVPKASPKNNEALLVRPYPIGGVNKIYLFDLENGAYEEVISTGKNDAVLWAPTGNSFAFTRMLESGRGVFLHDFVSGEATDLRLMASIDRLAFSQDGEQLFASLPTASGGEKIVSIAADTGEQKIIYTFDRAVNAINLMPIGQKVYFVSAIDGKLYGIE